MAQQQLQQRKTSSDSGFISKYISEQNNSSDEEKEVEVFESPDYEPFMAKFQKYKPELTGGKRRYFDKRVDQPQI